MEQKIIQDAIHGKIQLEGAYKKIIETKEFSRLQDIVQTGNSYYDYPGLKKSTRYDHSIGSMYVMDKIIASLEKKLEKYQLKITEEEKEVAKIAMLLHDIGHGAYSHAFEKVTGYSHEKRSIDIVKDETMEIHSILVQEYGQEFLNKVVSFLEEVYVKKEKNQKVEIKGDYIHLEGALKSLISNNIDADRLDYLIRDSTGAKQQVLTDINAIIDSFEVVLEKDEILLAVPQEKMYLYEISLLERVKNYLNLYKTKGSEVSDKVFQNILEIVKKDPEEVYFLPEGVIKDFFCGKQRTYTNQEHMEFTDTPIEKVLQEIQKNTANPVLKYLCAMQNCTKEFLQIPTKKSQSYVDYLFKKQFPIKESYAKIDKESTIKVYKKDEREGINVITPEGIEDFASSNLTHLIDLNPKDVRRVYMNPKLLAIELGKTEEEYQKEVKPKVEELIKELSQTKEQMEIRYIIKGKSITYEEMKAFLCFQYPVVQEKEYLYKDTYFDNSCTLEFCEAKQSLRIREQKPIGQDKTVTKIQYRKNIAKQEKFLQQVKKEEEIGETNQISGYQNFLQENRIRLNEMEPVLKAEGINKQIRVNVKGIEVDVNLEACFYKDTLFEQNREGISTITIKVPSKEVQDRIALLEIKEELQKELPLLEKEITEKGIYAYAMENILQKHWEKEEQEGERYERT